MSREYIQGLILADLGLAAAVTSDKEIYIVASLRALVLWILFDWADDKAEREPEFGMRTCKIITLLSLGAHLLHFRNLRYSTLFHQHQLLSTADLPLFIEYLSSEYTQAPTNTSKNQPYTDAQFHFWLTLGTAAEILGDRNRSKSSSKGFSEAWHSPARTGSSCQFAVLSVPFSTGLHVRWLPAF